MRTLGDIQTPWGQMTTVQAVVGGAAAFFLVRAVSDSGLGKLLVVGAAAYALWKIVGDTQKPKLVLKEPLPTGAVLTGKTENTATSGKPGEEVLGFAKKTFAEVLLPSGQRDWAEVAITGPYEVSG